MSKGKRSRKPRPHLVEGVIVPTKLQHIVTVRILVDGRPADLAFFEEDVIRTDGNIHIAEGAHLISAEPRGIEAPPIGIGIPESLMQVVRKRLAGKRARPAGISHIIKKEGLS